MSADKHTDQSAQCYGDFLMALTSVWSVQILRGMTNVFTACTLPAKVPQCSASLLIDVQMLNMQHYTGQL